MAPRKSSSSTAPATRRSQTRSNKPLGLSSTGAEFQEATQHIPYQPKSVFPSEMFLFVELANKMECDGIIESGGRAGGSTSYLSGLMGVPIFSICSEPCALPGVKTYKGDARNILLDLIRSMDARSIAILIDGPKGDDAVKLAQDALNTGKVAFVAVHDLTPEQASGGKFNSQDEAFRKEYGFLDENIGAYLEKYPNGPGLTIFTHFESL